MEWVGIGLVAVGALMLWVMGVLLWVELLPAALVLLVFAALATWCVVMMVRISLRG